MTLSPALHAENLYNGFLVPSVATDYSAWDVFYTPYNSPNYPDFAAPYGTYNTASGAGVTPPANSSPANPSAFWNTSNPTITQTGTSTAFIIGPAVSGNIYSFAAPTTFELNGSGTGISPYSPATVLFQSQTDGSAIDFSSVRLQYTNTSNQTFSIPASQYLKEYRAGSTSGMGLSVGNRLALEWNLTGLNVKSYKILFGSTSASMSLQQVSVDTASTAFFTVPQARTWTATGSGSWNTGSNWSQGTSSVETGNVFFNSASATNVTLNSSHTIGEMVFQSASNVTITASGGSTLTGNTGISTTSAVTGVYTINPNYGFGAYNVFDIEAGTVKLNGAVSGNYGMFKLGAGTLELNGNNSFTGAVGVQGGTLRLGGSNAYTGGTSVVYGTIFVAGNAPGGGTGALGNDSTTIAMGADSTLYANQTIPSPAAVMIEGDYTVARNITMADGTHQKILGSQSTTNGATFSGTINLGSSTDVHFKAVNASDKVTFTNGLSGGATSNVPFPSAITIDGQGTVVYGGSGKTYSYLNDTKVTSGTLKVASGSSLTSNGAVSVVSGSKLMIDGTLGGSGALDLHGTLGGSGTVNRAFTVDSTSIIAPGNSTGTLTTGNEVWANGGTFKFELSNATGTQGSGWDFLQINGSLSILATAANAFHIDLDSLGANQLAGAAQNFNPATNYSWKIASSTLGITGFATGAFVVDNSDFLNAANGSFSVGKTGNDLFLLYTVPEPSTYFLFACGLGLLVWQYRRHARSF